MLYENIKKVCKQKGISVTSVENAVGLGNGAISKWSKSSPTVANLQSVAAYLQVPIEELLAADETTTMV